MMITYLFWEKQVGKDQRRNIDRKMDLQDHYVNYINWKNTKLAKDIERTVELLPEYLGRSLSKGFKKLA